MPLAELFDNEFKQRNKGHFSALVRVAYADGRMTPEEKAFLEKLARNLEIADTEFEEILENPLKYPVNPPHLYLQRIERLYDLVRMVHVDHHLGDKQDLLLKKIGLALGFTPENVNYIVDKAFALIEKKADIDTFMYEMEHMNK
ncbi:MAG TPA: TerB family tellurite resistance protein [Flavobacterium sp.]